MNKTQIQTMLAPLIAAAAAWLAAKFPLIDPPTWTALVSGTAMALATLAIGIITKKVNLADTLGAMNGTTVVTDKKIADALPANSGVVANTEVTVVKS